MKLKNDKFISGTFSHPSLSGSNSTVYTIVHNKGRTPDRVSCEALSDGVFKEVFGIFRDDAGQYRGFYVDGDGSASNLNQIQLRAFSIHSYGGGTPTIRFVLTFD